MAAAVDVLVFHASICVCVFFIVCACACVVCSVYVFVGVLFFSFSFFLFFFRCNCVLRFYLGCFVGCFVMSVSWGMLSFVLAVFAVLQRQAQQAARHLAQLQEADLQVSYTMYSQPRRAAALLLMID